MNAGLSLTGLVASEWTHMPTLAAIYGEMTPANRTVLLGVGVVLVVASVVGGLLQRRAQSKSGLQKTVENLNARIRAWWGMVAILGLTLALGFHAGVVIFAFMSFLALREFVTATPASLSDHRALFWTFFIILPVQYILVWKGWYGMFSIFIPVYGSIFLPLRLTLAGDHRQFLERTSRMQWGLMVCVYFISHLPMLLTLQLPGFEGKSSQLLLFLITVVQSSDVLQYVWGKVLGRHKVAPVLSPSKTWEGLIGGVLSASALGAGLAWMTPFSALQAFGISLACAVLGFFGGLVMSAIKRDRGIKDWGQLIEGHGGMLDRIDSLCFSAPFFFHLIRYVWT